MARSDVLIDNLSPGALDRLGLGFEVLSERNPRLLHASIKGFLPGPYGDRALTDEPAQMMGGLAYMTGPKGRPLRAGTSVIDITGALFAAIGILAALREREQTGRGRRIDVGLFESVVFLVGQHIARASLLNEVPVPMPERGMGRDMGWGIYRIFRTRDDRSLFVAVMSDPHWENFCREFALDALWADAELRTTNGRAAQSERLCQETERLIGALTFTEAVERLRTGEASLRTGQHPIRPVGRSPFRRPACAADGEHPGWAQGRRRRPAARRRGLVRRRATGPATARARYRRRSWQLGIFGA